MSQSPPAPDPYDQDRVGGRPTAPGRRAGRSLVPGTAITIIIGFIIVLL